MTNENRYKHRTYIGWKVQIMVRTFERILAFLENDLKFEATVDVSKSLK